MSNEYLDTAGQDLKTAEVIHAAWDRALAANDVEGLLRLYDSNATLESPLVPHLLGTENGVCKGHKELRQLFEKLAERKPSIRKYYKQNFFTDGKTLIFEYPRHSPHGEQMDFVEVMEVDNGLIQNHRVYWGWRGFKVIQEDAYHR